MNTANKITIFRILLTPFVVLCIIKYRMSPSRLGLYHWAAVLSFFAASISDAVDGIIARLWNQRTELGSYLDPIADKILLDTAIIILSIAPEHGLQLPLWFVILVISRDVILIGGGWIIHVFAGNLKVSPSISGKCATFLQMVTVAGVLMDMPGVRFVWIAAGLFTAVSAAEYIWLGGRQLSAVTTIEAP